MIDQTYLLLSIQIALTTHVNPLLRAVTVDCEDDEYEYIMRFYYDSDKINDFLFDLASCASVEAEVIPGDSTYSVQSEAISLRYPQKIPIRGTLVFLRNEPGWEEYKNRIQIPTKMDSKYPFSTFRLYVQQALLGKVTPNLREIIVRMNEEECVISFYIFFDGEISEKELSLMNDFIQESTGIFSEYQIEQHIKRVDVPEKPVCFENINMIPTALNKGIQCVYARYEP